MPLLEELLARAGIAWADLDALAVGTGPGNFTGLRVGVAATRGLALALAIPAIGATGFEAMALDLPRPLRVVIPAGRGMVHVQDFPADAPPRAAARLSIDDLPHFGGRVVGALARDDGMAPPDAGEAGGTIRARYPLTEAIARIARTRLAQPGYVQGPRPAPFYLRGPDAHPSTRRPPPIIDA